MQQVPLSASFSADVATELQLMVCFTAGQPVCTLALAPHSLHTDINGDGVLEHAFAIGDSAHAHKGHHMHDFMNPCTAYVYSCLLYTSPSPRD